MTEFTESDLLRIAYGWKDAQDKVRRMVPATVTCTCGLKTDDVEAHWQRHCAWAAAYLKASEMIYRGESQ